MKWLGVDCDIFIMDCPHTRDRHRRKVAMYKLIHELKDRVSIVMISEELMELIGKERQNADYEERSVSKDHEIH